MCVPIALIQLKSVDGDKVCDKWNILSDKDNCEEKKNEVDTAQKKTRCDRKRI